MERGCFAFARVYDDYDINFLAMYATVDRVLFREELYNVRCASH